jgi:hypothetical protein
LFYFLIEVVDAQKEEDRDSERKKHKKKKKKEMRDSLDLPAKGEKKMRMEIDWIEPTSDMQEHELVATDIEFKDLKSDEEKVKFHSQKILRIF